VAVLGIRTLGGGGSDADLCSSIGGGGVRSTGIVAAAGSGFSAPANNRVFKTVHFLFLVGLVNN
jgi:hypothetical protein